MSNRFGELLGEGLTSVAKRQKKRLGEIEQQVAEAIGYTHHTVQRWRRGNIPKESGQVEFLVRYCVGNGRVDHGWAQSFLTQARYPEPEELLQELFPEQPEQKVPSVYHNLQPRYGEFLGRQSDIARVLDGLASRWPLVSIEGLGGVGKTTLAIEAARRCLPGKNTALDLPFDAVVWVSAKDRPEQKRWLNEVLDRVAHVLNYLYIDKFPLGNKPAEVHRLLQIHHTLVVVDNFETIEDPDLVAWIQRIPEPSKVLITSRQAQLRTVWTIHLRGLEQMDALKFIRHHAQRLGLTNVEEADERELLSLVGVTDGNPKAIEMALSHVRRGLGLDEVIDNLHVATKTLGDIFDYLFKWGWEALNEDSKHVLLTMPFFVESVSKEALNAVAGLRSYRLDAALEQLVEMSLVEVNDELDAAKRRYGVHPLTRTFADMILRDIPDLTREARERWSDYYIQYVERYGDDDFGEEIGGGKASHRERLKEEIANIRAAIEWGFQQNPTKAVRLVERITTYLLDEGKWAERLNLCQRTLEIARTPESRAGLLTRLAWSYQIQGDYDKAQIAYDEALDIVRQYSIRDRLVHLLRDLGRLYSLQGNYAEAIRLCTDSLELGERIGQEIGILLAKHFRARAIYESGELQKSKQEFLDLLPRFQQGHPRQLLVTLRFLGNIAISEGRFDEARVYLQDALENVLKQYYESHEEAQLYQSLGRLEEACGNFDLARKAYEKALDLATRLGMEKEMELLVQQIERLRA